jgi:hypothetical protein
VCLADGDAAGYTNTMKAEHGFPDFRLLSKALRPDSQLE